MKKNKINDNVHSYKIYREEFGKLKILCNESIENIDLFRKIVKNSNYKIFYNDEDVTKRYII